MRLVIVLSALLFATGCPSRSGIQQGQGDKTVHERGSTPGARAFEVVRADDLLLGISAEARIGDTRMENAEIAVLISAPEHLSGFGASGGNVLDAGLRTTRADALQQLLLYLDGTWPRQAIYTALTIVEEGGPGVSAVVEVRGRDSKAPQIEIVTRYTLPTEGRALELSTEVHNTGKEPIADYELGDAVQWGQATPFAPGLEGPPKGRTDTAYPWLAAEAEGVSYGWVTKDPGIGGIHGGGWSDVNARSVTLAPGAKATFVRHLVVGDGSVGSVLGPVLALKKTPTQAISGKVQQTSGGPAIPGALVEVLDEAGMPYARFRTDTKGHFEGFLPADKAFKARASTSGRKPAGEPVSFETRAAASLSLEVTRPGLLRFVINNRDGVPIPGKIIIKGRGDTPDPNLGPSHTTRAAKNRLYTLTGTGDAEIPPGSYTLVAARGPEYTISEQDIDLEPDGSLTTAVFTLKRVLDTTGWLAGDFHQHALNSSDSPTALDDRVISNLAEGVEILGSSDHNFITDYGPTIEKLGVRAQIAPIIGNEVTTTRLGHFNAFPVQAVPDKPAGGALAPGTMTPEALFEAMRGAPGTPRRVVQINHPRSPNSGYFTAMGLDPETLEAEDPAMSWGFDAIEIFNGRWVKPASEGMEEWFRMLNKGGLFVAMGNSDTHLVVGDEPGYARTMIHLGHDDPARLTPEALVEALIDKRAAVVTNGPMITATLDGTPIGGFLPPKAGKKGTLEIVVQAAPWIGLDKVEVVAGGEVIKTWDGLGESRSVERLRATLEVPIGSPTWYVVRTSGSATMAPVVPGKVTALAFTNPIWVGELIGEKQ